MKSCFVFVCGCTCASVDQTRHIGHGVGKQCASAFACVWVAGWEGGGGVFFCVALLGGQV